MADCTYPPPVERGDTVAVVAPSHAPPDAGLERGVERLRSVFDLNVDVYDTATRDTRWLRDHPDARAADVNRAFRDDDVTGVVAAFGGNREVQILDGVDRDALRESPKRFLGASDNTHLHLLLNRLGVVSFYGGTVFPDLAADPEMHLYTERYVRRALRATPFGRLESADEWTDDYYDLDVADPREWSPSDGWHWRDPGSARGTVAGGCFSMLESQLMLDDAVFPGVLDPGDVLAVETSGETPGHAEVERFFTVLGERGVLDALGAVLLGRPETPKEPVEDRDDYRRRQRETVARVTDEYADYLPVVSSLDFGHTAPVLPLPLGAPVEIDGDEQAIRFPEV
jgi:muramoyltetrapeptide carboxypeptidase LdcA involved in peptidoglycan recycling